MKKLIKILENRKIKISNMCYKNYEIKNNTLIVKKAHGMVPSTIETREMIDIYQMFENEKNIDFKVLDNGDISIERVGINN
ncbi:hypothetical protein CP965_13435 [Halarcobacter mediterraneus]|uniref:Uncharacterized protein n=1 Tax=Halarcobacter mediterraneus TaxID=2023153 RepID=A0A4Q1ARA4_9BACT|nr:hypothetical protein [Halarcobacter mediterraneus]RXK11537.1 hypothetical protein CP965_13435 [Halarcobacter mediterraneus]